MNIVNIKVCKYEFHDTDIEERSFENFLLRKLKSYKEFSEKYEDEDMIKLKSLFSFLEDYENNDFSLYEIFVNDLTVDFEFVKQLRINDTIVSDCLYSNTDAGKELIVLMKFACLKFQLVSRSWESKNKICLNFNYTYSFFESEAHNIYFL